MKTHSVRIYVVIMVCTA